MVIGRDEKFALSGESMRYYGNAFFLFALIYAEDAAIVLGVEQWILYYNAPWRFYVVDIPQKQTWTNKKVILNIVIFARNNNTKLTE